MRILHFVKQAAGHLARERHRLFALFTPLGAERRGWGTRLVLAGGTAAALGLALAAAINAVVLLLAAMGVIYYLLNQVMGVKLEFDPRSLVQQAQRYASANSAPN